MMDIFNTIIATDTFWAFVGFFIFCVILIIFKIPLKVIELLDRRAKRISDEIEEARNLYEEARKLMVEYQRKHVTVKNEMDSIIAKAERDAAALLAEAKVQVQRYVTYRNKIAEQKIIQAENDALSHVRSYLVDTAITTAAVILEQEVQKKDKFLDASLNEIEKLLCQDNLTRV